MPLVPGVEGSGVITKMGAEVKDFKIGDRVAWVFAWGSYAELINIPEASLVKTLLASHTSKSLLQPLNLLRGHELKFPHVRLLCPFRVYVSIETASER